MDTETKNRNNTKVHNVVSVSKTIYSQNKPEKFGLLKRFLDWIAKGACESHMGRTSCPT
jgi:hypothetical protein